MLSFLQTLFRSWVSVTWAMANGRDLAPLPLVTSVEEIAKLCAQLTASYHSDPLDYTERPERLEYHRQAGTLPRLLGLDCDDVAYYAVALCRRLGLESWPVKVDSSNGYTHAVCYFRRPSGTDGMIDTNGLFWLAGWPSLMSKLSTIYPLAHFTGESRLPDLW